MAFVYMRKTIYVLCLGAGLLACSFAVHKRVKGTYQEVKAGHQHPNGLDSLLQPYKAKLDTEMNQVIGEAEVSFVNGKPWGNLGNLISDVQLAEGKKFLPDDKPAICLLNSGGLRAPISKGAIVLGDIFKVLPFDNMLELVYLDPEQVEEFELWLSKSAGHPLAGCRYEQGKLLLDDNSSPENGIWVVSSDYLMNGGDNATFLTQAKRRISTGKLLRDVMIDYVKQTGKLKDIQQDRFKP